MSKSAKAKLMERLRKNREAKNKKFRDPHEWRPKYKDDEEQEFRVIVLPPLLEGDKCLDKDGEPIKCKDDWDFWYFQHGHHFIKKQRLQCPRQHSGDDCPMCDVGFDLMRDVDDKKQKSAIAREWLSSEQHAVNILFTNHKINPEELRGQVKWWNMPSKIWLQCEAALDRKEEDAGDEEDPKPYGMFFDPDNAFPVKVILNEKAGYNNYDGSALLGKSSPISKNEDEIENILSKRNDIPSKFDEPDIEALTKVVEDKLSSQMEGSFDDDQEEIKEEKVKTESNNSEVEKVEEEVEEIKEEIKDKKEKKKDEEDDDLDEEMKDLLAQLEDD